MKTIRSWRTGTATTLAALAIVVGALLVIGIVRTVLRVRRRQRPETDAATPGDAVESAGEPSNEGDGR